MVGVMWEDSGVLKESIFSCPIFGVVFYLEFFECKYAGDGGILGSNKNCGVECGKYCAKKICMCFLEWCKGGIRVV